MTGTRHRTDHQSRLDRWRRQIQRQQKTKLTIADFCRQLGVSVPTFDYGKRRIHGSPCTPFGRLPVGHSSPHPFTPAAVAADLARRLLRELSATRLKVAVGTVAAMAMAMLAAGIRLTDSHAGPPAVAGRARTGPDDRGADSLPKFARARLGDLRFYHGEWVRRTVYTPDGRSLVTLDQQGRLRVWDAAAGRTYRTIGDPALRISEFALSPDGTTLATDNSLSRLQLWDMATGRERRRWHEPREGTHSDPRFSPDGRTLAVIATRPSGDPKRQLEAFVELVNTTVPTERTAGGLRGAGRICGTSGSRPTGEPWRRPATIRPPRMGRP